MRWSRLLIGLTLLSSIVGACSDDSGPETNEYSAALADSFRADPTSPLTDDQIDCLAVQYVDDLGGPDRFSEAGVDPEDVSSAADITEVGLELTQEDGAALVDSIQDCDISLVELILSLYGPEVGDGVAACAEENIDGDALASYFAEATVDETAGPPPDSVTRPLAVCLEAG